MTRSRRSQRGAGKLKAIVFTVILILAIYMAFKIVPAYVSEYQLQDKMQELARFSVVNRYSAEQVRDNVYKAVQELDIPAKRDDIKVTASGGGQDFAGLHGPDQYDFLQHGASFFTFQRKQGSFLKVSLFGPTGQTPVCRCDLPALAQTMLLPIVAQATSRLRSPSFLVAGVARQ